MTTCQSRLTTYGQVKDPVRAVLKLLCGGVDPPEFVHGHDFSGLTDSQNEVLQNWVASNLADEIHWSTGIGAIEAAEQIVAEAVANANIAAKEDQ